MIGSGMIFFYKYVILISLKKSDNNKLFFDDMRFRIRAKFDLIENLLFLNGQKNLTL